MNSPLSESGLFLHALCLSLQKCFQANQGFLYQLVGLFDQQRFDKLHDPNFVCLNNPAEFGYIPLGLQQKRNLSREGVFSWPAEFCVGFIDIARVPRDKFLSQALGILFPLGAQFSRTVIQTTSSTGSTSQSV